MKKIQNFGIWSSHFLKRWILEILKHVCFQFVEMGRNGLNFMHRHIAWDGSNLRDVIGLVRYWTRFRLSWESWVVAQIYIAILNFRRMINTFFWCSEALSNLQRHMNTHKYTRVAMLLQKDLYLAYLDWAFNIKSKVTNHSPKWE